MPKLVILTNVYSVHLRYGKFDGARLMLHVHVSIDL